MADMAGAIKKDLDRLKPEWKIYKNDQCIGQAVTWHKALYNLTQIENLNWYTVEDHNGILFINSEQHNTQEIKYKILKEN